jgi:hypothetical protein
VDRAVRQNSEGIHARDGSECVCVLCLWTGQLCIEMGSGNLDGHDLTLVTMETKQPAPRGKEGER